MKPAILIVTGGLLQVPAVHIARELGLHVIVTDRDEHCACAKLADEFLALDIFDIPSHVAMAQYWHKNRNLQAVFTEGADVARTVSLSAAAVGLPCVDPRAAYITNYKPALRKRLQEAGVEQIRWMEVRTAAEAQQAADFVGFPLIVKNTDSSASRGTTIIREKDILAVWEAAKRAMAASRSGVALVEELLTPKYPGLEHTVETLMAGDWQHRCFITDRFFTDDPTYAVEKGIQVPTKLPAFEQYAMYDLAWDAAEAVGVDFGAAKFDMMWTPDGPRIIEMAARLSGGCECQWLDPLASGREVIKCAMIQALGGGVDPKLLQPKWDRAAVAHSLMPPVGKIRAVTGVVEASAMPGVEQVIVRKVEGDVVPEYHDCVSRAGWVVASGDNHEQAWTNARAAGDQIYFEMEGDDATRDN